LQALSSGQYAAMTTNQFQVLTSNEIAAMTTAQAAALTTDQIVAFTTDQIPGLETTDIAALSALQVAAFETQDIAVMSSAQLEELITASPIVLDLDGNGVSTLGLSAGVKFDLLATGNTTSTVGWVATGDALLVRDRNGDGIINDGRELYGVATENEAGQRMGNGYAALGLEDSNGDGKVNASDATWGELRLWVDANSDGKTDAGELHGLADFGVVELSLAHVVSDRMDNGNHVGLVGSYTTADGKTEEMADVWFAKQNAERPALGDLLAAPQADLLGGTPANAAASPAASPTMAPTVMKPGLLDDDRVVPLI
jgi:hypothetical protein